MNLETYIFDYIIFSYKTEKKTQNYINMHILQTGSSYFYFSVNIFMLFYIVVVCRLFSAIINMFSYVSMLLFSVFTCYYHFLKKFSDYVRDFVHLLVLLNRLYLEVGLCLQCLYNFFFSFNLLTYLIKNKIFF